MRYLKEDCIHLCVCYYAEGTDNDGECIKTCGNYESRNVAKPNACAQLCEVLKVLSKYFI